MIELLGVYNHDLKNKYSIEQIAQAILCDKKRQEDYINFITLKDIGCPCIEKIEIERLKRLL